MKGAFVIQTDASFATSASLLQRAKLHDPVAWQQLCQIYAPLVYGWTRKRGVAAQEAPDVVQEVFRVVAAHLQRFRSDRPGDTFRGWLITITRTEIYAHFRRRAKQPQGEGGTTATYRLQELPDESSGASDSDLHTNAEDDRRLIIRRAAAVVQSDFAPNTWQAFWRSVVDDEAPAVIAAELGMTTNAIRQARFRVLKRLREILADCEHVAPESGH